MKILIVHQVTNEKTVQYDRYFRESISRPDVTRHVSTEAGLSKSRNVGMALCATRYALIGDDDTQIFPWVWDAIVDAFTATRAAIVTFRHTNRGEVQQKYAEYKPHTFMSIASVASVDIALDIPSIREHNLYFDEHFGLGTRWPSGEEYIFLSDARKCGLKLINCSVVIASHPEAASGRDFYSTPEKIIAKREMFLRVSGKRLSLLHLGFFLKKIPTLLKQKKLRLFAVHFFQLAANTEMKSKGRD